MAELVYDENGRLLFTKEMKEEYTILFPTMLPVHFGLMARILETEGFHVEMLTTNHRGIVDEGLKYVHNDTCYPALLVIGQLIDAVKSGKYDMHKVALMITQTGGGCRASNYIHLLRKALAKADLLIMVGTRAADRAVVDPAEIQRRMATIHIDVDPAEIGKNMQAAIPLVGDVKVILQQLLDRNITPPDSAQWLTKLRDYRTAELNRTFPRREGYVFPGTVLRKLGQKLDDDAIICVDVGQNQIFTCKYLPQKHGRLLTSGGLGTMGYALPAGVGAKVAAPDRQTVVICGDGSFQMAMNELSAIVCGHMDVKIVLFQNQVLGLVNQIQNTAPYHGAFGVALDGSPDFAALAGAYGIPSMCADDEDKLDGVLEQFLSTRGSCVLICKVHPDVGTND